MLFDRDIFAPSTPTPGAKEYDLTGATITLDIFNGPGLPSGKGSLDELAKKAEEKFHFEYPPTTTRKDANKAKKGKVSAWGQRNHHVILALPYPNRSAH